MMYARKVILSQQAAENQHSSGISGIVWRVRLYLLIHIFKK